MMKNLWLIAAAIVFCAVGVMCMAVSLSAEPTSDETQRTTGNQSSVSNVKVDEKSRVSLDVARDRAKLMHEIYNATLEVMHRRYFHGDRAVIPARAMEDVFSEMKRQTETEAHWISVSFKAMSIDHDPKNDFEIRAAKEIGQGNSEFEVIEDGYFRRAGAIRLTSGCIGCHGGLFKEQEKTPRYAALVISVPLKSER